MCSINENLSYLLYSYTNPIFGKVFFWRYGAKCSQRIRLQDYLINSIFRTNLLVDTNSHNLKVDQNVFWVNMVKNRKFLRDY